MPQRETYIDKEQELVCLITNRGKAIAGKLLTIFKPQRVLS